MSNPSGPYPGRQLFLGLTAAKQPCLAYLVTGRSPASRQRKAVPIENTIRIGPLGDTPYDPLRHYTGLKYDDASGVAAVSNGIQTEAVYETYKLLFNVGTAATKDFMEKVMEGAEAEPDSLHTPRIAGAVIINEGNPILIVGIKTALGPAVAYQLTPAAGKMNGVATYKGDMESPAAPDPKNALTELKCDAANPHDLAKYLYDLSAASYKDEDIRVCAVGGIYTGGSWDIALVNSY